MKQYLAIAQTLLQDVVLAAAIAADIKRHRSSELTSNYIPHQKKLIHSAIIKLQADNNTTRAGALLELAIATNHSPSQIESFLKDEPMTVYFFGKLLQSRLPDKSLASEILTHLDKLRGKI